MAKAASNLIRAAQLGEREALDRLLEAYRNYLRVLPRMGIEETLRGKPPEVLPGLRRGVIPDDQQACLSAAPRLDRSRRLIEN